MYNFDNLDKVSNIVCKINSTLCIKHVVELRGRSDKKDSKPLQYGFYYDNKMLSSKFSNVAAKTVNSGNLLFNSNGYLVIENKKNIVKNGSVFTETLHVKILVMDGPQVLSTLNTVLGWLTSQCENVFMNDELGHPIKVMNPSLNASCPLMLEPTGIAFKPCIVEDTVGNRYQGIAMGNREKGEICNFTATEFVVFKNMLGCVLNNFYANNMLLASHALEYCMYKNFMEVLTKNAQRDKPQ